MVGVAGPALLVFGDVVSSPAPAQGVIEEFVVEAQRREERVQDVPIAVSAFDDTALDRLQLSDAEDLQLVVPNLTHTDTNFGGNNFTLRGIGRSVIGDGADSGVAFHFNDVYLHTSADLGFFDIERVDVLRGPQGTLFGRNATGGAINIVSRRPTGNNEAYLELEVGSFDTIGGEGAFNYVFNDRLATRLAFSGTKSDGYVTNLTTGEDLNGGTGIEVRSTWSADLSDTTSADLIVTYMRSTGDTLQGEKRFCSRGDLFSGLGCSPDSLGNDFPNYYATLGGVLAQSDMDLLSGGTQPLLDLLADPDPFLGSLNPRDPRQVAMDFDPKGSEHGWYASLELRHQFESLELVSVTGYVETSGFYVTDPDLAVAAGTFNDVPGVFPGGFIPTSAPDPLNLGSLGGTVIGFFNRPYTLERGEAEERQWVQELRLASDFAGRFNFLVGAFYLDLETRENLYNISSVFDAVALSTGGAVAPGFFRLETPVADLTSYAGFGEAYFDLTDTFALTAGLRWTHDEKKQTNRSLLLNAAPVAFESNEATFEEWTGRVGVDWAPQMPWTGESLFYAFYSRGYKGGGFNPSSSVASVAPTFDPEFINAYEIGTKNSFLSKYQANLAAFYYDYEGLQVSKIENRTSVNENIDATIWGVEGEVVGYLTDTVLVDFNFAYLNTEIGDASSVDPRDPSAGLPNSNVIIDTASGSNCVISDLDYFSLASFPFPYGDCASIASATSGNAVNLKGNELQNAPDWAFKAGIQKEHGFGPDLLLTARLDYSWRSDFWGRIFNRDPVDKIDGWGVLNAQAQLESETGDWYLRVSASNLLDEDAVTGLYVTDATSGLATNAFYLPPRSIGVTVGVRY